MSTKKKPPPHTVAARTEKTAATRATKRDDSDSLRALWYAAAAAWHAADPSEQGCEDWDDMSPAAEAARFYFWRARLGVEAVDKMRTAIRDEDHAGSGEYFKKPPGFKGWSKLAASLFDELGVSVDVDLAVGDKREWSVYHLEIIRDAKDPLYCPRGERPPPREFVKSIGEYDGVYDPIKVVRRKPRGIPIVSDGRQRTNGVRVHNAQELVRYYAKLEQTLRYHEPQRSIIEKPNTVDDIELPKLIRAVPILVHDVKRGRILKAISNANRVSESVLDEARAVWDLHDEFKEQGKSEWIVGKIARLRSSSDQVVYNYLKLRKLTHKWQEKLAAGMIAAKTGYRLGGEPVDRQNACWTAYQALERDLDRVGALPKLDEFVTAWLEGRAATVAVAPQARENPKVKVQAYDAVRRLRQLLDTDKSDEHRLLRLVLRACEPSSEGEEARQQLPPSWRVAILDQRWRETDDVAGWNAIGVFEPETAKDLERSCLAVWVFMDQKGNGGDLDVKRLLEWAGRPWGEGLTIGAAYEQRRIDQDKVEALLDDEADDDEDEDDDDEDDEDDDDDDNEDGEATEEPREQLSLPSAAAIGVVDAVLGAVEKLQDVVIAAVDGDDTAEPAEPRSRTKRKAVPWVGFESSEQEAWEKAGVRSYVKAMEARGCGFTPEQMSRLIPLKNKPRNSLGVLFMYGSLTLEEVQKVLADNPVEAAAPAPARPWVGFGADEQAAWRLAGVVDRKQAMAYKQAKIKPREFLDVLAALGLGVDEASTLTVEAVQKALVAPTGLETEGSNASC